MPMAISVTTIVLQQEEKEWNQWATHVKVDSLNWITKASTTDQLFLAADPYQLYTDR